MLSYAPDPVDCPQFLFEDLAVCLFFKRQNYFPLLMYFNRFDLVACFAKHFHAGCRFMLARKINQNKLRERDLRAESLATSKTYFNINVGPLEEVMARGTIIEFFSYFTKNSFC